MTPTLVYFSFSRDAQPEVQGPSSLLDDGFLYCILSPTGLQNSIGGPESPFGRVWLSLPHFVSDIFDPQLIRGSKGPLHRAFLPHLISNISGTQLWLPVLTELYDSSTLTQSPTQSLEWHVWSSSSGNNCHAVHRSLSSGGSVYECTMGILPCPILLAKSTYSISPHKWHRNVPLPSGASLWNGMFARVEGQNTTQAVYYEGPGAAPETRGARPHKKCLGSVSIPLQKRHLRCHVINLAPTRRVRARWGSRQMVLAPPTWIAAYRNLCRTVSTDCQWSQDTPNQICVQTNSADRCHLSLSLTRQD